MQFQSLLPTFENPILHALDEVGFELLKSIENEMQGLRNILDPKKCDAKFLPFLAHENAVDFWGDHLNENEKRNLISFSKKLKRKKGTLYAVEQVLEQFEISAKITEWMEYEGNPYHFKIDISGGTYSASNILDVEKYINVYKNVRSILEELNVNVDLEAETIYTAAAVEVCEVIELDLILDQNIIVSSDNYIMVNEDNYIMIGA